MANGTATMPDAAATREVATIGSRLSFNSAFQPAWKAAAASTARKTKRSMACGRRWLLGNAFARRARWSAASYPHQTAAAQWLRDARAQFARRPPREGRDCVEIVKSCAQWCSPATPTVTGILGLSAWMRTEFRDKGLLCP